MFGRKCSLCGGKLDGRNICKECGLDNTKSDKYYKLNRSSCDNIPLTHVHEDGWKEKKEPVKKTGVKKTSAKKTSVLVSIISVIAIIIPALIGIFESVTDSSYVTEDVYYVSEDPYQYLEKEHPLEGETVGYEMESGQYIVGVHIAEGNYNATTFEEFDSVEVRDDANGIYLYEYAAKDQENYLGDLRLYNGARVIINSRTKIILESDNAQTQTQVNAIENYLQSEYYLNADENVEAGISFEPGVYDIYVEDSYAYISLMIVDGDGEEWNYGGYEIGTDAMNGTCFKNVFIPDGAIIMSEGADAELVPSSIIGNQDYTEYYPEYYF